MIDDENEWKGTIHSPDKCAGRHCCFHNPSAHHMVEWRKVLRASALVERLCPHGVGHPDPDSLAYFESIGQEGFGVHGCDGCCRAPGEKMSAPKKATEIVFGALGGGARTIAEAVAQSIVPAYFENDAPPPPKTSTKTVGMTVEQLEAAFEQYDDEYMEFARIESPRHRRPDLCAFLMLDEVLPGKRDMVAGADHDIIYLDVEMRDLAPVATPELIRDLRRCGVCYSVEHGCLTMNASG